MGHATLATIYGARPKNAVTETHLKIMKSMAAPSSNGLQWLNYMARYQDNNPGIGR